MTHEKSVIATLLVNPRKYLEIGEIIRPEMFFDDQMRSCYEIIAQYEAQMRGWNKATIQSKAGLEPHELIDLIKFSDSNSVYENATIVRDKFIENQITNICLDYPNTAKEKGYESAYHDLINNCESAIQLTPKRKDDKGEVFQEALDAIIKNATQNQIAGITTGWADLDTLLGGWVNGNLVIIGARPAMGKTTVMMHHVYNAALSGIPVGVISLEMTKKELISKLIAQVAEIPIAKIRAGQLNQIDVQQAVKTGEIIYDLPIFLEDFSQKNKITIETIIDETNYMVKKRGVKLLLIDYLQLIDYSGNQTANYEVQNISRQLKRLAKNCNIPIIALAQLSRGIENRTNKRPMMADLRDSGSIEQDADIVIGLYREEYYNPETPDKGLTEYIILKDRQAGKPFTLTYKYGNGGYKATGQVTEQAPF
jgi:replicative DNA helicase